MAPRAEGRAASWWVTAVFAVAGVAASVAITAGLTPRIAASAAHAADVPCGDYGVAVSADWGWKSPEELQASYAMARNVGACQIRISVPWGDVETAPGYYDWSQLDMMVHGATAAGIEPMLVLYAIPGWVQEAGVQQAITQQGASSLSSSGAVTLAASESDRHEIGRMYSEFAAAVAARYKDSVYAYEVWNEPNISRFWTNPSAAEYAELLKLTYPRIHQADPSAVVISAGLAPAADTETSISPTTFVSEMYKAGAKDSFDALGVHPYTWNDPPEERMKFLDIDELQRIMDGNGDAGKQMWVTEYGAPTGGLPGLTQSEQAAMLMFGIEEARRNPRIERFYFYTLQDYPLGVTDPESYFGIYTSDGGAKVGANELRSGL